MTTTTTTTTAPAPVPAVAPSFDDPESEGRKLAIICSKGNLDMAYPGLILANAALGEVRAEEPEHLPVPVGQRDADLGGEGRGELLGPLLRDGEEALLVDVELVAVERGGGHGHSFTAAAGCLPAMDMCAGRGIGRPGSRTFQ